MEILGIDIGGSGIKGAIVDVKSGEMLTDRIRIPTPKPAVPKAMRATVLDIADQFKWKGEVGVSFPTVVKNGVCRSKGNISPKWVGVEIDNYFAKKAPKMRFHVGNDADLAGLAEMQWGAGKGKLGKVLMVTVGTGLGTGFFFNGQLVHNFELGYLLHSDGKKIELFAADSARKREELKLNVWAERLDHFLNYSARILNPGLFILGGGISKKFDQFKDVLTVETPVEPAHFRNNAGIIGAAVFAQRQSKIASR